MVKKIIGFILLNMLLSLSLGAMEIERKGGQIRGLTYEWKEEDQNDYESVMYNIHNSLSYGAREQIWQRLFPCNAKKDFVHTPQQRLDKLIILNIKYHENYHANKLAEVSKTEYANTMNVTFDNIQIICNELVTMHKGCEKSEKEESKKKISASIGAMQCMMAFVLPEVSQKTKLEEAIEFLQSSIKTVDSDSDSDETPESKNEPGNGQGTNASETQDQSQEDNIQEDQQPMPHQESSWKSFLSQKVRFKVESTLRWLWTRKVALGAIGAIGIVGLVVLKIRK